ncbi:MAG TPA: GyrI-like domain-containing protein, partial [Longimicrobium sp.]|nr:GyrI-like domain-containing protein [Longimicrobium sp.]
TTIEPSRIARGRAMLLAGLRRVHSFADAPQGMPAQWEEFLRMGMPPGQVGTATYGVICSGDPQTQTVEYMAGVEVAAFENVTPEYGRVRVFPQTYAVFTHRGHVSTIGKTWDAIWNDWLPGSGHQTASAPDFELYDERFDPATGSGEIEIWVPIQADGSAEAGESGKAG